LLSFTATVALADDDDWRWRDRGRRNGGWNGSDDYRRERDRDWRRSERRGAYGGPYGGYAMSSGIVRRTIDDLRIAASRNRVDSHERNHFERAVYHLQRFDSDYSRGGFPTGRLDDAMEHLADLARADQIHPRDRQMLARDLSALRSFRSAGRARW
jgi:hypothetical protein